MNDKLLEIGEELGVSRKDLFLIKRKLIVEKISKLFYPLFTAIASVLLFAIGCVTRDQGTTTTTLTTTTTTSTLVTTTIHKGYPFAASIFSIPIIFKKDGLKVKIFALVLAVIGMFLTMKSIPVFGQAIEYSVYYIKNGKRNT